MGSQYRTALKKILRRKVNTESNAAYGYGRCGETRAVQQCWDQVRLLQRLQFSKTDAPADKRTLNDDDVTQIQITECVVTRSGFVGTARHMPYIMDLFFVSQALKYTTATTQLLTDMGNPDAHTLESFQAINVMHIVQPTSKTMYICTQPTLTVQDGVSTEACLSVSQCDTSSFPTKKQVADFRANSDVIMCSSTEQ